jgi:hypothetical protein
MMNKTSQWVEAYKIVQLKEKQKQADFYNAALNLAKQDIERNRMSLREMQAWSAFCESLPREQARPGSGLQGSAAGWLQLTAQKAPLF